MEGGGRARCFLDEPNDDLRGASSDVPLSGGQRAAFARLILALRRRYWTTPTKAPPMPMRRIELGSGTDWSEPNNPLNSSGPPPSKYRVLGLPPLPPLPNVMAQ